MGDISQKGLKVYEGRNLTIVTKSMDRYEESPQTCRKGAITDYDYRASRADWIVYQNKFVKTSHLPAYQLTRRFRVLDGEPNGTILSMFTEAGLNLIESGSLDKTFTRMCGKQKITTTCHYYKFRRIACYNVDRFRATVIGGYVYLRASVRPCTVAELLDYASRSMRGKAAPFYRQQIHEVNIVQGMQRASPTLARKWKNGRLISRRTLK